MGSLRLPRTVLAWTHVLTCALSVATLAAMVAYVAFPTFHDLHLLAGHDWDEMEGYRYLVVKTIRRFHQFPYWNPYTCGGHPVWGGVESDTTVVSPFFPVYLFFRLPVAMRIELVGNALLSVSGGWLFAGRFTRSPALRTFVAAVFALNSRWTLQIGVGHTWHYAYEWTPWTLYFLDRALEASVKRPAPATPTLPWRDIGCGGACMAMMVYMGGIYPVPQTALIIAIYAGLYAVAVRDWRPIFSAAGLGIAAFALSAPKLLPTLEVFARFPRTTDSPEWMDLKMLMAILTSREQDFFSRPVAVPYWGWHEWGMYIGAYPLAALVVGVSFARGERVTALKWTGLVLFVLALGNFDPKAPWSLLHDVSLFRSQHVPSRWLYPAGLLLGAVAVSTFEAVMTRSGRFRSLLELAAMAAAAAVTYDVGSVSRVAMTHMFSREPPRARESIGPFYTSVHMPAELGSPSGGDWAPSTLPNVIANVGMTDCGSFAQFENWFRDHNNHTPGLGAKGMGEPGYRGEVYVAEKHGRATVARWTPNEITVQVSGARAGDHVILNQNWDPGWTANGKAPLDWADLPAAVLSAGDETVVFRYVPPLLWFGVAIFVLSVSGAGWGVYGASRKKSPPQKRSHSKPKFE